MATPRRDGGSQVTSRPAIVTVPESGVSSPAMIRSVVDFPHPEGPSSTAKRPGSAVKLTPSTAGSAPQALRISVNRTSANFPTPAFPCSSARPPPYNGWKVRAVEGTRGSRWLARLRRPADTEELPTVHPRCYILPSQWPAIQRRDREGTMPGPRGTLVRYSTRLARGMIALALLVGIIQSASDAAAQDRNIIIFVWDGLRPDSTYPTFTMMNAASFATGGFPGSTGYYGNTVWQPGAQGPDSANVKVDFQQPVFTEDYAILDDLTRFLKGDLLLIDTLFEAAQQAGMVTAAVGKTGAAFLQDYKRGGLLLDEKTALPLSFAKELQAAGIPLPATAAKAFEHELPLAPNNGNPIEFKAPKRLKDGVTFDPTDSSGSPYTAGLQYM